ncbi:MAG: TraR/DksA C4-type zinc finger protein [Proteobacteria bacterium]|nr:TraR/DksA C4-type zinc finger protein [Pseudomonadota bacterium]MDA0844490.1 TraR/DksA C4-type zinc finger protein [Pseudomonadota bacterium]
MADVIDINALRQSIMDEIAELDRLRRQAHESRALVAFDQQSVGRLSRMDAMQQQAMHIANDARRQQRHMALLAALKRMDAGDFGYCHHCDEEIGAGRLAIDPAVTLCVHCTQ